MNRYGDFVYEPGTNNPVVGVIVTVYVANTTTPATLYTSTFVPMVTPVMTDQNGFFEFWVTAGVYDLYILGDKYYSISVSELTDVPTSVQDQIDAIALGQASGVVGYATLALLQADTTQPDGAVGLVTNDSNDFNNTYYRFSGGAWVQSDIILDEVVSVYPEEYGAVGNGIVDDTAAIQYAIATGKDICFRRNSTYKVSQSLVMRTAQTFYGNFATIKRCNQVSTTTADAITSGVTTQFTVADASIFTVGQTINILNGVNYDQTNRTISDITGNVITVSLAWVPVAGNIAGGGSTLVYLAFQTIIATGDCRILNLKLDGNSANWSNGRWETAMEIFLRYHKAIVDRCQIFNAPGEGIVGTGDYSIISNNVIYECEGNGIHLSTAQFQRVEGNVVYNCNKDLLVGHVVGAIGFSNWIYNCTITNNYMKACEFGIGKIDSEDNSDVTISNNTIIDMVTNAINGDFFSGTSAYNIVITGNRIYNSKAVRFWQDLDSAIPATANLVISNNLLSNTAVEIQNVRNVSVIGNNIVWDDTLLTTPACITLSGTAANTTAENITVIGNTISGGVYGILLTYNKNVVIEGNTVSKFYMYGINAPAINENVQISHNNVYGNADADAAGAGILSVGHRVHGNFVEVVTGRAGIVIAGNTTIVEDNTVISSGASYSIRVENGTSDVIIRGNKTDVDISNGGGLDNYNMFNSELGGGGNMYPIRNALVVNAPTALTCSFDTMGLRDKSLTMDAGSSPYDKFNIISRGATAGWKGTVTMQGSYSLGSLVELFKAWADNGFVSAEVPGRFRLPAIRGPYADDTAAGAAGLTAGEVYRQTTTGAVMVKL